MTKKQILAQITVSLLILLTSLFGWCATISKAELGQLRTMSGSGPQLNEQKQMKLLYFWATWCPDCKEKIKGPLIEVSQNPDFEFLFVNTEKDPDLIKNYIEKENVKFEVLTDFDKSVRKKLKVFSVPQWALLKQNGDQFDIVGTESGFDYDKIKSLLASHKEQKK